MDNKKILFKTGGPLTQNNSDLYVVRSADETVLRQLLAMEYVLVIEPRQQGKTSLVNRLIYSPALGGYILIYIDVSSCSRASEQDWYQTLCERITGQLGGILAGWQSPSIPVNATGWRGFLHGIALVARSEKRRTVIALDEIGAAKFPGVSEFFTVIRDVYNSRQVECEFNDLTFMLLGAFQPR